MKTIIYITIIYSFISGIVLGADYLISSADELISFSNNVNNGTIYEGTTVFLDNDIDFSETTKAFTPIGTESGYKFRGTFDGQGHTIDNLKISKAIQHTGLFGYSTGMTVKNVVIGSTCTVESTHTSSIGSSAFFSGIIAECEANDGDCIIENSVNMADITFSGTINNFLFGRYSIGGGVYGRFSSENGDYDVIMRNCANYGTITQTGSSPTAYLGGLYGDCHGTDTHVCVVENCINAGNVYFKGTATTALYIGGLSGKSYTNNLTNCVSIGLVYTNQETNYTGAITGGVSGGSTTMTNCVWTEGTNMTSGYGKVEDGGSAQPDTLSGASSTLNTTTLAALNSGGNNKWLLNTGRHTVEFYVNGALTVSTDTALVQQPDFSGNGGTTSFNGWYTDASCTQPFNVYEIVSDTKLYGTYGVLHTITFILNETAEVQSQQPNGASITFPLNETLVKTGHSFNGWNNTGNIVTVPDYDITFEAQWIVNEYTVTFDFDNGTAVNETFNYGDDIVFPLNEALTKIGYSFNGWNNTGDIATMPDYDITFTAQWIANPESSVESFSSSSSSNSITNSSSSSADNIVSNGNLVQIVFGNKGLTEEEAMNIIRQYSDYYSFTIEKFGINDDSDAFVIIKFEDVDDAKNFVEIITAGSDPLIKTVNFIDELPGSLSFSPVPLFLVRLIVV